jgi:ketosteroid isomerase-like protein
VDRCAAWFPLRERAYREAGSIGPRVPRSDDADAQSRLLAAFGRDDSPRSTFAVVTRFNSAFAGRAVDEIMSTMTDDCVFEDTAPPDGHRYDGQAAVRAAWETLFRTSPDAKFETEEGFVAGNRAVYRWCYRFDDGHVRSVDVFTTRDGLVAAKRSYVKG